MSTIFASIIPMVERTPGKVVAGFLAKIVQI
jgi:hypothetical protein